MYLDIQIDQIVESANLMTRNLQFLKFSYGIHSAICHQISKLF